MDRIARLELFARLGFAARGLVYIVLGYFALHATAGGATDAADVLERIEGGVLGNGLLAVVGLGLASYGVYRIYGAVLGLEGDGTDTKGVAIRIGHAISGVAHILLGYYALRLLFLDNAGGVDSSDWAAWLMTKPLGNTLLMLIAAGLLLAAINQAIKAVSANFMRHLDADAPGWTKPLGRAGYAARTVVFALIAWLVASAAASGDAEQASGVSAALGAISHLPALLNVVAAGLVLFGAFSLVEARYRRINDAHVIARLKAAIR